MTESKYRSNVGIIAVAILLLFTASTISADPASGHSRSQAGEALFATTETTIGRATAGQADTYVAPTPLRPPGLVEEFGTIPTTTRPGRGPGGIKVVEPEDDFQFEARLIEPAKVLTNGGARPGFISNCFVDFNEDAVLQVLPYQAIHTVVEWPFWNEYCAGQPNIAIAVEPIGASHYHLNYVDKDLRWCTDLGTFGRPQDPADFSSPCDAIDPLSEPREAIQPHQTNYGVRVYAYHTQTKERLQFTMNQLRIVSGDSEVCFVRTDLPWIAAGPTDQPAGYCGDLGVGNWDVSATVTDAYEVRIYSRSPNNSFTDIGLATY